MIKEEDIEKAKEILEGTLRYWKEVGGSAPFKHTTIQSLSHSLKIFNALVEENKRLRKENAQLQERSL